MPFENRLLPIYGPPAPQECMLCSRMVGGVDRRFVTRDGTYCGACWDTMLRWEAEERAYNENVAAAEADRGVWDDA